MLSKYVVDLAHWKAKLGLAELAARQISVSLDLAVVVDAYNQMAAEDHRGKRDHRR